MEKVVYGGKRNMDNKNRYHQAKASLIVINTQIFTISRIICKLSNSVYLAHNYKFLWTTNIERKPTGTQAMPSS